MLTLIVIAVFDVKIASRPPELIFESVKQEYKSKPSVCFPYGGRTKKFISSLERASIEYEIHQEPEGIDCIYWQQEDDEKVLEIDPHLKEIRTLETERKQQAVNN